MPDIKPYSHFNLQFLSNQKISFFFLKYKFKKWEKWQWLKVKI